MNFTKPPLQRLLDHTIVAVIWAESGELVADVANRCWSAASR